MISRFTSTYQGLKYASRVFLILQAKRIEAFFFIVRLKNCSILFHRTFCGIQAIKNKRDSLIVKYPLELATEI